MKIAAAHALAALAREDVPDAVAKAYGVESLQFGPDYLIPKPLDPRILMREAPAVARAAMETGVARVQIDLDKYKEQLEARLGKSREMMRIVFNKAKANPKRIVFAEGEHEKTIRAAHQLVEEGIARPVLLGDEEKIRSKAEELQIHLTCVEFVNPRSSDRRLDYAQRLYDLRKRKGVTKTEAWELVANNNYYASVMLEMGEVDGMISGLCLHYPEMLRPPLQIIKTAPDCLVAAGVYMVTTRDHVLFFADTTVNIELTAETLAEVAILTARLARDFDIEPRVAMLSFSDFGSVRNGRTETVRQAVEIVREREPGLVIDGEMRANTALVEEILNGTYPFNRLKKKANVLIFPSLEAGNIAYRLVQELANAEVVGPILVGMRKPVYVLQREDEVKDIVNLAAIAVVEAQKQEVEGQRSAAGSRYSERLPSTV
jgi:malate dehydrogenase (oxaloacetate-decarboxylating)(NADP+)